MKKMFVLACLAVFVFVGTAFSEPIDFPNGLTIDVAPGWSYEAEDERIILIAEDNSCAISIIVSEVEGVTSLEAANEMAKEHQGTEPAKIDDNTYEYSFIDEKGSSTKVFVEVENGKLKVLSITGDHKDVEDIIDSIKER